MAKQSSCHLDLFINREKGGKRERKKARKRERERKGKWKEKEGEKK